MDDNTKDQNQTPIPNEPVSMPANELDVPPPQAVGPAQPDLVSPAFSPAPNMPPPPPASPPIPENQPSQNQPPTPVVPPSVSAGTTRKFPKKIFFMAMAVLLLLVGIFAIVRIVLPNIGRVAGGPAELVWWGLWEDDSIVAPIIEEYQNANPGVTIRYEKKEKEDYRERLTSALATDDAPDIFRIHSSWVPMFRQELSPAPTTVITAQEFQSTFYPVASNDLIGTAGPLAMPLEYDGLAMFINEDIFSTYGQPIPSDWNELRQIAKALTIKDERGLITQSGVSIGTTSNVDHWPEIVALLMLQNGANPNSPNDTAGRGIQALRFYAQFSDVDKVWDDTQPTSTVAFATGRVAMYFAPSWRALEIKERAPSLKFRVESVPQIPQSTPGSEDITYASYWVEGVSLDSRHSEEAWKFLKFLSEKETLTKLYENASRVRLFGEPYPRVDMRELLLRDPILGGFMELAPVAKSGYLHSRTFDGASGINTSLVQYYQDAVNSIDATNDRIDTRQTTTLSNGVQQVLSRYGLAAPLPTEAP